MVSQLTSNFRHRPDITRGNTRNSNNNIEKRSTLSNRQSTRRLTILLFSINNRIISSTTSALMMGINITMERNVITFFSSITMRIGHTRTRFIKPRRCPSNDTVVKVRLVVLHLTPTNKVLRFTFTSRSIVF